MGTAEEREAFWRTHHEAWQRSNLNQREYCEAHGLVLKRFENWRSKFKDEPEVPQKLLYRRGGRPSHMTGHMPVPMTKQAPGSMTVLAAGAAGRRRFSQEDRRRIVEESKQPGCSGSLWHCRPRAVPMEGGSETGADLRAGAGERYGPVNGNACRGVPPGDRRTDAAGD